MLHWFPAVLYMAGIFIASSVPDVGPLPLGVSDKSVHGLAYAGLAVLVLYALARGRLEGVTPRRWLVAILISTLYGMSDEWHQSFVPGRTADWGDVLADGTGALAGSTLAAASAAIARRARSHRGPRRPD